MSQPTRGVHTHACQTSPSSDLKQLRQTIELMDCLAQDGFSAIEAIARLALSRFEMPRNASCLEDIARALEVIKDKAQDIQNLINVHAEELGCGFIDPYEQRRLAAQYQGVLA